MIELRVAEQSRLSIQRWQSIAVFALLLGNFALLGRRRGCCGLS